MDSSDLAWCGAMNTATAYYMAVLLECISRVPNVSWCASVVFRRRAPAGSVHSSCCSYSSCLCSDSALPMSQRCVLQLAVLWVSMMVGMLKGFSSGAGVLYSKKFRQLWFPRVSRMRGGSGVSPLCITRHHDGRGHY